MMTMPSLDRFKGAMLYSAVGDALGWPTESVYTYSRRGMQPFYDLPAASFVAWTKYSNEFQDYAEPVLPGEYSDDTQLSLAVARCISADGSFEPERFAYLELPLWLQYVRGGGKRSKAAARLFLRKQTAWHANFYKTPLADYRQLATNGAVMRNIPIALANVGDEQAIIINSFLNAIVTHGHPGAILGAILYGLALSYVLTHPDQPLFETLIPYLCAQLPRIEPLVCEHATLSHWIEHWDERSSVPFWTLFSKSAHEAAQFMEHCPTTSQYLAYYKYIGARYPLANWASGVTTVCAALYLFLHYLDLPEKAVVTAADTFGSDTDTIAACVGALQGAYYGADSVHMPQALLTSIQDHDYLVQMATHLHSIAAGRAQAPTAVPSVFTREYFLQQILSWETQYFLPLIKDVGLSEVVHPVLGTGNVLASTQQYVPSQRLLVKSVRVQFLPGQSCLFRASRDEHGLVSEVLHHEIEASA